MQGEPAPSTENHVLIPEKQEPNPLKIQGCKEPTDFLAEENSVEEPYPGPNALFGFFFIAFCVFGFYCWTEVLGNFSFIRGLKILAAMTAFLVGVNLPRERPLARVVKGITLFVFFLFVLVHGLPVTNAGQLASPLLLADIVVVTGCIMFFGRLNES